jgi:MoaA/NifB/PqqE/SkfB family radical SAM enzyme
MDKKPVYCTAPWNGLTIRENGHVRTCCVGKNIISDLNVDQINNIEQSTALQEIRNKMLAGEPDLKNCANCIEQEKNDGYSALRNHYNSYYPNFNPNVLELKFIDLRWNNTCNLNCMYCSPTFSSTWADKLKTINLKPVKSYQDELLTWLLEQAGHVKELMLVGGEPLLMKQNYELLKVLPLDCRISIITNLSYDLKNLPCLADLLKRPSNNVVWNISVDNVREQFEYVRHGASWTQLVDNIEFLKQHWPDSCSINMVYSMFNALDLLEIFKTFKSFGLEKFNLIPLEGNNSMNLSYMPEPIRHAAKAQLLAVVEYHRQSLHPEDQFLYPIQGVESFLAHLDKQTNNKVTTRSDFQKQIKWYDQWSGIPFVDLWPDVIKITNQHLA